MCEEVRKIKIKTNLRDPLDNRTQKKIQRNPGMPPTYATYARMLPNNYQKTVLKGK